MKGEKPSKAWESHKLATTCYRAIPAKFNGAAAVEEVLSVVLTATEQVKQLVEQSPKKAGQISLAQSFADWLPK